MNLRVLLPRAHTYDHLPHGTYLTLSVRDWFELMSSPLWCSLCLTDIGLCLCPEADAQLHEIAYDPTAYVTFKWCRLCDKHYARCRCQEPDFYIIAGGKAIDPSTLRDMFGRRVEPDLHHR